MLLPQKTLKGRKNSFEIAIEKKAELTKLGLFVIRKPPAMLGSSKKLKALRLIVE